VTDIYLGQLAEGEVLHVLGRCYIIVEVPNRLKKSCFLVFLVVYFGFVCILL
jgi:hypothetical protein